jgi:hypothetical protein
MSIPASTPRRPGRGWYVGAAALALLSVTIVIVLGIWIVRALVGYDIEPIAAGQPVEIVLTDRGESIWVAPEAALAHCESVGEHGESSFTPAGSAHLTITDGGHDWSRLGVVKGRAGSHHTLTCEAGPGPVNFGRAPDPQLRQYVVGGIVGGLVAGLSAVAALAITLVVAILRNRRRQGFVLPAAGA